MRLVLPFRSIFYATVFVAQNRGMFSQNGLEVELSFPPPLGDPVDALSAGRADLAVGGPVRLMRYSKAQAEEYSILGQVNSASGFYLVAQDDVPRGDWQTLKGRSIVLFPGSKTPWLFTRALLMRNGVTPSDIRLIPTDCVEEGVDLFRSGQADLIESAEPITSMLEQETNSQIWLSVPELLGNMPFSVVMGRRAELHDKMELINRFQASIATSQEWLYSADSLEIAQELQKSFPGLSMNVLTSASRRYRADGVWARTFRVSPQRLEALQDTILGGEEGLNRLDCDSIVHSPD